LGSIGWILVDRLARLAGRVDQHRSRIDELFDLERLKRSKQPPRPLDIDLS
jgi:hypothetical protein